MIELFYVEDDPQIADTVKGYLEQKGMQVRICSTLEQARKTLETQIPSLVLLDWNMPDGAGDALCRWIRNRWKELPVIFLTVRGDTQDIVDGFQAGADDYVVKPFELEVLYSRIQALLRRSGNKEETYLSCNGIVIDRKRQVVTCHSEEIALSPSEYQLLLDLLQHKGRTVTREQILEQVWDLNGNYVNNNTLTVTVKRLRDKLHHPACLKTVRSVGYRMEDLI
ncbi:MAG: response regulator transcription factor [Neglectibacter timonensis]